MKIFFTALSKDFASFDRFDGNFKGAFSIFWKSSSLKTNDFGKK